ncbi:phosphodiesterase [Mycolicibacterium goodii]|uniref:Phosphodiesterase n=1 Tax=Mycolicibacterium goodii TaxID=134601 RepID=A0ABS6HP26_MYCGD|nr:phosphodiesterase [Mycolicibacterium goodii]MBU8824376.1 phosphodiesterase [Mycolicibacterium goodii]MBU8827954.1 phosphodiesterase [Mycolicibacterium goodii]MBU8837548.1 phosphodiesterase [Mycolicibacterium goodii]OKH75368.1 phosphodiesterase [Mycobacterium sp. SWH-M5]
MKLSDVAAVPIQIGSALRHRRLFHPSGVLAHGTLDRTAPIGEGLPVRTGDVVGRISKGIGSPGSVPDIAGLAWRMGPDIPGILWDVLLASTLTGNRLTLWPATSWTDVTFSSLMPLKFNGSLWWLRARLTTPIDGPGLSLDRISEQIRSSSVDFDIEQAPMRSGFRPLARLSLHTPAAAGEDVAFDPVLNTTAGVSLTPDWLAGVRRVAYRRSRVGRDAE